MIQIQLAQGPQARATLDFRPSTDANTPRGILAKQAADFINDSLDGKSRKVVDATPFVPPVIAPELRVRQIQEELLSLGIKVELKLPEPVKPQAPAPTEPPKQAAAVRPPLPTGGVIDEKKILAPAPAPVAQPTPAPAPAAAPSSEKTSTPPAGEDKGAEGAKGPEGSGEGQK